VSGGPGLRGRILLAEDNEWNVETLQGYLEDKGFEVAVARDGEEAVEPWSGIIG
jgi:CheY-like chemotaxis protein